MALPPRCKICNKDIRRDGQHFWIDFKKPEKSHADKQENKHKPGWVGPVYSDEGAYFCKRHKSIEKYSHLIMEDAVKKYRYGIWNAFLNIFRR